MIKHSGIFKKLIKVKYVGHHHDSDLKIKPEKIDTFYTFKDMFGQK